MTKVEEHFWKVMAQDGGAEYYKVDLHIHTPSSVDQKYKFPQQDAEKDIERGYEKALEIAGQILDKLVEEGVSVAAFTDHNSPSYVNNGDFGSRSWYELIREVYEQRRNDNEDYPELLLLPGVEITTDRIHVLGIFDDQDEFAVFKIASLLRSVDIREAEFGQVDAFGTKSIWDVADAIDELGGICIPAHINHTSMRSLLTQYQPPDMEIERLVQHRAIHVFGVVPPSAKSWREDRSYRSILENKTFKKSSGAKMGYHDWMVERREDVPQHLPALGYMMNSDAHSVAKIGERFSWVKMDDLSFRSLASALRNPFYRIWDRREEPASQVRSHVLGVSVEGGFADGMCLRFNEHFNCIVGRPTTGKTTLMRLIRDTFWGRRLGLRIRDELKWAIDSIADGLWEQMKGGNVLTKDGLLKKRGVPEELRQRIQDSFLETHGLPWTVFVFFSQAQLDGGKVIYAAERTRSKGSDALDGREDHFHYYESDVQPDDLDLIEAVRFSKIGEGHTDKSGGLFRNKLARPGFYFGRVGLGDEKHDFPGARSLLDNYLLRVMDGYDGTRGRLWSLCHELEEAAGQTPPDTGTIAAHAAEVRQSLEQLYSLREAFAQMFNETEQEHALRIAFRKGQWQEVVADTPEPGQVSDYVHKIRQYLHGYEYYDILEMTFYQRRRTRQGVSWKEIPFSRLTSGHRSMMALRLLLNSSFEMAPVFIDGPERWLNNEALVEFCDMRRHRDDQLIFLTQNPNMAVLGNAEQTIILDVDKGRTKVVARGGLEGELEDELKDEDEFVAEKVIRLLEGGDMAFQRKLLRYQAELRRLGLRVELQRPGKT